MGITIFVDGAIFANHLIPLGSNATYSVGSSSGSSIVIHGGRGVAQTICSISVRDKRLTVRDGGDPAGIFLDGTRQNEFAVAQGDVVVSGSQDTRRSTVALSFYEGSMGWAPTTLSRRESLSIGREADNDLVIPGSSGSAHHAVLRREASGYWIIEDLGSFSGTFVDGVRVVTPLPLTVGQRISAGGTQMLFMGDTLFTLTRRMGIDLQAEQLVRYRGRSHNRRITNDHISLHIRRGEFIAIVGASGSGKTTLLNELSGREQADEGRVFVDGVSLYDNYSVLRKSIGFVPQQDTVHDNLTLTDMLDYSARLRLPPDTTDEQRAERVQKVIEQVQLEAERDNMIGRLSGGQKKRASIAIELLSEPRLLFLDEPTSGLDPGIERDLMIQLATMARSGRTIVLVTHTTTNLNLCDRVIILGSGGKNDRGETIPGGKLCYFGPPSAAPAFFGVYSIDDVFDKVATEADKWEEAFAREQSRLGPEPLLPHRDAPTSTAQQDDSTEQLELQFGTLAARYLKLILNDHSRLALLLLQAPILAALIAFAAGEKCFLVYENTKSCLFALSCAAYWVGILDSIQEICKERDIFRREFDSGMRVESYVFSKLVVLGGLCIIQALLLSGMFYLVMLMRGNVSWVGTDALVVPLQLFVTSAFIMLSAMCTGLVVSALTSNPDRAIAAAPILIMPQILFAGVVVELQGIVETVSYLVSCRWGMSGYGTASRVYGLPHSIVGKEIDGREVKDYWDLSALKPKADDALFNQGFFGIAGAWSVMLVTCIGMSALCLVLLKSSVRPGKR